MGNPDHRAHWHPTAAYLYVLGLDALALAWEYLRRHPDYRLDWQRRRGRSSAAQQTADRWGLRLLEDPGLDARDAHPAWLPGHMSVVQLHPDADPPPDARTFGLWRIPGHKQLLHDGHALALIVRSPGCCLRFVLAPGLEEGIPAVHVYRDRGVTHVLDTPAPMARPRPPPTALLEMHTLQALDAILAGASLREVAEGLFGANVRTDWSADGGLRSKVRRLVRRGDALMRGGYRRLAQLPPIEQGRSDGAAKRP